MKLQAHMNCAKAIIELSDEADLLPFGPPIREKRPLLASQIAHEIRSTGGEIWLIQKLDSGLLFRCQVNGHHVRVVVPGPRHKTSEIQLEANSRLYVADDLITLREFLNSLSLRSRDL